MGFSDSVRTNVLIKCKRYCCWCGTYAGLNMELHHIEQRADGGQDTEDNCTPLCFNCHAEVERYNDRHPKGLKIKADELKIRRDQIYDMVKDKIIDIHSPSDKSKAKKLMECYSKYLELIIDLDPCAQGIPVNLLGYAEGIVKDLQLYEYTFENFELDSAKCDLIGTISRWSDILSSEQFFHLINDGRMLCFNNYAVNDFREDMYNLRLSIRDSYMKLRNA